MLTGLGDILRGVVTFNIKFYILSVKYKKRVFALTFLLMGASMIL